MNSEKINLKLIKIIIYDIAKNDGITLSEIAKKRKIKQELVEGQDVFIKDLGLLEDSGDGNMDIIENPLKLKNNLETLQKIAHMFDNKELSKIMRTDYYKKFIDSYSTSLLDTMKKHNLPLPDSEYMDYALGNSPSNFRFFLVDNDINTLKSFYQRCITSKNEKVKDTVRIQLFEKYDMYLIWDNVIFGKIQDDIHNGALLNQVNFYATYLPIVKKTFENLLQLYSRVEKEEKGNESTNSKFKQFLKSM